MQSHLVGRTPSVEEGRTPPVEEGRTPPVEGHDLESGPRLHAYAVTKAFPTGLDPHRRIMSNTFVPQQPVIISQDTRASFTQHLREHPSSRRISPTEKENLIQWLTNPEKRPSSQREFSRRNYVRNTFLWDNETQDLLAINKTQEGGNRIVVAEDRIADIVELVHNRNGHAGWDATWKDVSMSYYGILRSDVIYLLRRCQVCRHNPAKRPKNHHRAVENLIPVDPNGFDLLNPEELEDATLSPLETGSPTLPSRQY